MTKKRLSVVIPVLNEAALIKQNLDYYHQLQDKHVELLFVDGGSSDKSPALLSRHGFKVLESPRGRARQMNLAARHSCGDTILFLHADSRLPQGFKDDLEQMSHDYWGFFRLSLNNQKWLYRLIAWGINLRSACFNVATGDQGIFVRASVFRSIGGYRDIALMEDIELARRLRKLNSPRILNGPIVTSARRWESRGPLRTVALMWLLQLAFKMGVPSKQLEAWYR